jgi:hypothetical protein
MRYHVVGAHPNLKTKTFDILVRAQGGRVLVVSVAPPGLLSFERWLAGIEAARDAGTAAAGWTLLSDATVRVRLQGRDDARLDP